MLFKVIIFILAFLWLHSQLAYRSPMFAIARSDCHLIPTIRNQEPRFKVSPTGYLDTDIVFNDFYMTPKHGTSESLSFNTYTPNFEKLFVQFVLVVLTEFFQGSIPKGSNGSLLLRLCGPYIGRLFDSAAIQETHVYLDKWRVATSTGIFIDDQITNNKNIIKFQNKSVNLVNFYSSSVSADRTWQIYLFRSV